VIDTVLTVLAAGISILALCSTIAVLYVWYTFHCQVKAIRKERELESQHGEGN